jgi:hypothetical protein
MRYASLDGWNPDPRYPGFLRDPKHPRWLRSPDGRWWSEADVLEGRVEMTQHGPRVIPGWFVDSRGRWVQESSEDDELLERVAQKFREAAR